MSFATSDGLCLHWSLLYGLTKKMLSCMRVRRSVAGGSEDFQDSHTGNRDSGGLRASWHALASVGRLGCGAQSPAGSCLRRRLRCADLLSTFSGSQIPYSLCSFASSLWLGELLFCSTQLSPWQIRLGLSVPAAFLACSSHSKSSGRKKESRNRKITMTWYSDP